MRAILLPNMNLIAQCKDLKGCNKESIKKYKIKRESNFEAKQGTDSTMKGTELIEQKKHKKYQEKNEKTEMICER